MAILLLGSARSAHADSDVYNDITRHARSDDALHVDTEYGSEQLGSPRNRTPTSRPYKSCMLARGWRFSHTARRRTVRTILTPIPTIPD